MWTTWETDRYKQRYKSFERNKGQRAAFVSVLSNMLKLFNALKLGVPLNQARYGFLKPEGGGVLRIGEAGPRNVAATRLYVYPDEENEVLFLLSIGDKNTQSRDIKECKGFTKAIQADASIGQEGDGPNGEESEGNHGEDSEGEGDG